MRQPESWGHSTVRTACPLDCPDSCTIDVTVEKGRVVKIDGGDENPVTRGFICGKVRRFAERVYGEDRAALSGGAAGRQRARHVRPRHLGRGARSDRDAHGRDPRQQGRRSDPALLLRRIERAADAGHQRRGAVPRVRHLAPGAHGLRRADRRGQPGALRQDGRRHLSGLPARAPDHSLGREPRGLGHSSRSLSARSAEGRRTAGRHRPAGDIAGTAGGHPPGRAPGHRSPGRARHCIATSSRRGTPIRRSSPSTRPAPTGCGRAPPNGRSSGRPTSPASTPRISAVSRSSTSRLRRRWCAAAGDSSATATAAPRRPRCWRCPRWPASSPCAAAATR